MNTVFISIFCTFVLLISITTTFLLARHMYKSELWCVRRKQTAQDFPKSSPISYMLAYKQIKSNSGVNVNMPKCTTERKDFFSFTEKLTGFGHKLPVFIEEMKCNYSIAAALKNNQVLAKCGDYLEKTYLIKDYKYFVSALNDCRKTDTQALSDYSQLLDQSFASLGMIKTYESNNVHKHKINKKILFELYGLKLNMEALRTCLLQCDGNSTEPMTTIPALFRGYNDIELVTARNGQHEKLAVAVYQQLELIMRSMKLDFTRRRKCLY